MRNYQDVIYDRLINEGLLRQICELQGQLPLKEHDRVSVLQLLRLSPSALLAAVTPLEILAAHRNQGAASDELDQFDCEYFIRHLHNHLRQDFRRRELHRYFFQIRGLREIDASSVIKIKSSTQVEVENRLRERIAIGEADESLGSGFILVALLPDLPEPWEKRGMGNRDNDMQDRTQRE